MFQNPQKSILIIGGLDLTNRSSCCRNVLKIGKFDEKGIEFEKLNINLVQNDVFRYDQPTVIDDWIYLMDANNLHGINFDTK